MAPYSDPGKEVALYKAIEVFHFDICYTPIVHNTIGNQPELYQLSQPLCCILVVLVVVRAHP
jgi:hypothetical protein